MLFVAVLAAADAGHQAASTSHEAIRAAYEKSVSRCRHGHRGHVVHLDAQSPEPEEYLRSLKARAHPNDVFHQPGHHHFHHTFRGVAASLSLPSLDKVFKDTHVHAVEADCVYYLQHVVKPRSLGPRVRRSPSSRPRSRSGANTVQVQVLTDTDSGASTDAAPSSAAMLASGEELESQLTTHWSWGLDSLDGKIDQAYHFGNATGAGAVLYTIDTGVYVDHEDFTGGRVIDGWSIGCPTGTEADCGGRWLQKGHLTHKLMQTSTFRSSSGVVCEGHGTHTASVAAGRLYGVAKAAEIVVVQGLDCNGTASDSMFIAALDWAVSHAKQHGKPAVMSMSLGGNSARALDEAARRSIEAGYSVVAASGNYAEDSCTMSPGAQAGTISVASVGKTGELSSFSNRGSCTTILAPGEGIIGAFTGGPTDATSLSGTSMATPHVSGAVLQLLGKMPALKPEAVRRALACNAVPGTLCDEMSEYGGTPNRILRTGQLLDSPRESVLIADQEKSVDTEATGGQTNKRGLTHHVECHEEEIPAAPSSGSSQPPVQKATNEEIDAFQKAAEAFARNAQGRAAKEQDKEATKGKANSAQQVLQPARN